MHHPFDIEHFYEKKNMQSLILDFFKKKQPITELEKISVSPE